jgi:hypothetical protein
VSRTEGIRFDSAKNDKEEPTEGEAHVHVSQHGISFKHLTVQKALHEYLSDALHERFSEEASLKA